MVKSSLDLYKSNIFTSSMRPKESCQFSPARSSSNDPTLLVRSASLAPSPSATDAPRFQGQLKGGQRLEDLVLKEKIFGLDPLVFFASFFPVVLRTKGGTFEHSPYPELENNCFFQIQNTYNPKNTRKKERAKHPKPAGQ